VKRIILLATAAFAATTLGGCATVLNGTHTSYQTETQPKAASVKFSNGQSCTTPCKLEFRRKDHLRADIALAGYKPTYVLIQSKLGGATFGNVIAGGIIGGVVDASNGASNRLSPSPLIVKLAPEGSPEGAVLLDKKGSVIKTVKAHNDGVRAAVAKSLGPRLAGLEGNDPQ
jgi:hypothetical protein